MDATQFSGTASYVPQGQWSLPANVSTQPTHAMWLNSGTSNQSDSDATGNAVMNSSGIIIVPNNGRFDLYAAINAADWQYAGSMTVTFTYTPVNSAATSPAYTLGTINITPSTPQATVEQRVFAYAGDQISIAFAPSTAINTTVSTPTSSIVTFTDVTNDTNELYFYGVAGKVPTFASLNKCCLMQTAQVTNGAATLIMTQDGTTTGQSLFKQIVAVNITAQAPSTITSPLNVGCVCIDPIPTNMKTITAHVSVNGALPAAGWSVIAQIFGY